MTENESHNVTMIAKQEVFKFTGPILVQKMEDIPITGDSKIDRTTIELAEQAWNTYIARHLKEEHKDDITDKLREELYKQLASKLDKEEFEAWRILREKAHLAGFDDIEARLGIMEKHLKSKKQISDKQTPSIVNVKMSISALIEQLRQLIRQLDLRYEYNNSSMVDLGKEIRGTKYVWATGGEITLDYSKLNGKIPIHIVESAVDLLLIAKAQRSGGVTSFRINDIGSNKYKLIVYDSQDFRLYSTYLPNKYGYGISRSIKSGKLVLGKIRLNKYRYFKKDKKGNIKGIRRIKDVKLNKVRLSIEDAWKFTKDIQSIIKDAIPPKPKSGIY